MINQNTMAVEVAKMEGSKVQVNIAQIKEVQRCTLIYLAGCSNKQVQRLLDIVAARNGIERPLDR